MTDLPPSRPSLARLALGWGAGGFALAAALAGGIALNAQTLAAHDSNAPVSFDAQRIELQDRADRVILSGDVVIEQAGLRLRSDRTLVDFTDAGRLELQRITATGGVVVTRGEEQATGDSAIYDVGRRIITMAGNVRLRRGATDRLEGGRLVIDLNSRNASVDGSGARPGRVTGTFNVPQRREGKQP